MTDFLIAADAHPIAAVFLTILVCVGAGGFLAQLAIATVGILYARAHTPKGRVHKVSDFKTVAPKRVTTVMYLDRYDPHGIQFASRMTAIRYQARIGGTTKLLTTTYMTPGTTE